MAITAPQLNTALAPTGDTVTGPRVIREVPPYGGSSQYWYVRGGWNASNKMYWGRDRFVQTTASDDATTQAATVITAMAAGPTHQ